MLEEKRRSLAFKRESCKSPRPLKREFTPVPKGIGVAVLLLLGGRNCHRGESFLCGGSHLISVTNARYLRGLPAEQKRRFKLMYQSERKIWTNISHDPRILVTLIRDFNKTLGENHFQWLTNVDAVESLLRLSNEQDFSVLFLVLKDDVNDKVRPIELTSLLPVLRVAEIICCWELRIHASAPTSSLKHGIQIQRSQIRC